MKRFSRKFVFINYMLLFNFFMADVSLARSRFNPTAGSAGRRERTSSNRRGSAGGRGGQSVGGGRRGSTSGDRRSSVSGGRRQSGRRGSQQQQRGRPMGGREEVKRGRAPSARENIRNRTRGRGQAATPRRGMDSQQERQVALAQDELDIFSVISLQESLVELYKNAEALAMEQGDIHFWSLGTKPSDYSKKYLATPSGEGRMMEFHRDTLGERGRPEYDESSDEYLSIDIVEQEDGTEVVRTGYESLDDYSVQINKVKKEIVQNQAALADEIFNSMWEEDQDIFKDLCRGLSGRGRRGRGNRGDWEDRMQDDFDQSSLVAYDFFIRRMKRQDRNVENRMSSIHDLYYFLRTHPNVTPQDMKILFSGPTRMWGAFVRMMEVYTQPEAEDMANEDEAGSNDLRGQDDMADVEVVSDDEVSA